MMPAATPIIDCDVHPYPDADRPIEPFISADFREAIRLSMDVAPGSGHANPFGVNRRDANCVDPKQVAIDHLERYNIAYAVLLPGGMNVGLTRNIDVGCALARAWNDWLGQTWLKADERYLGSICVNMNDAHKAAAEIRRAKAAHPRMVQVLVSGESEHLYGHRYYYPVYEAMAELGLPLAVHPGREGALGSPTPVGRPSGYFEWHCTLPLTFQAHLISMVTEGVFEKFPKLKLLLTEGGVAWLAHTIWRMDKNFKALRSTTPWLKRLPSEYVFDHVRLTTQPLEEPPNPDHMLQNFEMIHAEKTLCFATDYPHWDFDDPTRVFPKKMSDELRRRIFSENAAELYGLPVAATPASPLPTRKGDAGVAAT